MPSHIIVSNLIIAGLTFASAALWFSLSHKRRSISMAVVGALLVGLGIWVLGGVP